MEQKIWRVTSSAAVCLLMVLLPLNAKAQIRPGTEAPAESTNKTEEKAGPVLTGDPRKDYIHDPNLPRELNGFDLSDYPFYNRVPNVEFNFTCDDRHDGFYASIPHKCQVYHNCLFGVRYDFLCANYTAFDQTNFNCNFAHEVDCINSELHFYRNEALYKEATTTTTTTPAPQIKIVYVDRPSQPNRRFKGGNGRRKRPTTPRPAEDDYYYYDEETPAVAGSKANNGSTSDDYYYYDDTPTTTTTTRQPLRRKRPNRPLKTRLGNQASNIKLAERPSNKQPIGNADYQLGDYDDEPLWNSRHPIKISNRVQRPQEPTQENQNPQAQSPQRKRRRKKKTTTTSTTTSTTTAAPEYYDEYYYDEEYDAGQSSTSSTTQQPPNRRPAPTGRPTAQDRRKALLQSRKSASVQTSVRQTPQVSRGQTAPADATNVEYDYADYSTSVIGESPPPASEVDYEAEVLPPVINSNNGKSGALREAGNFRRPQSRNSRGRTVDG